jgi:hypothetical protein
MKTKEEVEKEFDEKFDDLWYYKKSGVNTYCKENHKQWYFMARENTGNPAQQIKNFVNDNTSQIRKDDIDGLVEDIKGMIKEVGFKKEITPVHSIRVELNYKISILFDIIEYLKTQKEKV